MSNDTSKEPLIPSQKNSPLQDWKLPLETFITQKKTREDIKKIKSKKQRRFYLKQNAIIEQFEQIASGNFDDKRAKHGTELFIFKI
jgi:hypothetical protein